MEILIEETIGQTECQYELYRFNELLGQLRVFRNQNYDFEYESECSEHWVETYILGYLENSIEGKKS